MEPKKLFMLLGILLSIALLVNTLLEMKSHYKEVSAVDTYPAWPIKIIVPFSTGGTPDLIARSMEKTAMKHLGQPLIVTNIPGGAGTQGWNELAGAEPDGYTIGVTGTGVLLQPLYGSTRYHYPSAIDPLAQIGALPFVAVVLADSPWENINDLAAYAKEHPGEIKYGHPGLGTATHVTAEMFVKNTGVDIRQVPFSGGAEVLAALLGKHIQLMFAIPVEVKDHIKDGRLRVLAVATEHRLTDPDFRDVPTFKEQGLDVVFDGWAGIGAPKGLPEDVKNRLVKGLETMILDPEFQRNIEAMGMTVEYLGPQQFKEKWIMENERLTKIIKESGIAELVAKQKK